jgi:hypothetical protein
MNIFVWTTNHNVNMHAKFRLFASIDIYRQISLYLSSYNFFIMNCCTNVNLVKPTVYGCSRGFIQNLLYNFWTWPQVSTIFESLNYFLLFSNLEKIKKILGQCRASNRPMATARVTQRPATRGRLKSRLGLGMVARSSRGSSQRRVTARRHSRRRLGGG